MNSTAPPGSAWGQRWVTSPAAGSGLVTTSVGPPDAETRERPTPGIEFGVKRIVPSSVQVPPQSFGASASTMAAPPATATRFSRPSAKKPIDRPSGEKNWFRAPSAPASGEASSWSSRRR